MLGMSPSGIEALSAEAWRTPILQQKYQRPSAP